MRARDSIKKPPRERLQITILVQNDVPFGVWPRTLPARASEPWTFPIIRYVYARKIWVLVFLMPISRRLFLFSFCFFRRIKTSIFIAVVATFLATSSSPTYTHTHTHTQEQQKCLPTNNNSQNHSSTTAETTDSFCFRWSTMPFGKWYVYHTISFLLFSKIFLFSKRLKFVRVLTFSPLSLFLLSITVQESSSVVLDRWYVLLLLLVRSCLCSSLVLLLLCSRFGHFKN